MIRGQNMSKVAPRSAIISDSCTVITKGNTLETYWVALHELSSFTTSKGRILLQDSPTGGYISAGRSQQNDGSTNPDPLSCRLKPHCSPRKFSSKPLEIKSSLGARESYVEYCLEFHPHLGKIGRKKLTGYGYGWNFSEGKKKTFDRQSYQKSALW